MQNAQNRANFALHGEVNKASQEFPVLHIRVSPDGGMA